MGEVETAGAAITGGLTALAVRSFAGEAIPPKTKENQMKTARTNKDQKRVSQPQIVSREEWQRARDQLLVKEKAATRARDALAAERLRAGNFNCLLLFGALVF
jgi:hypothetical protein